eukprot:574497-Heterocapsa_arctica.AAC.1
MANRPGRRSGNRPGSQAVSQALVGRQPSRRPGPRGLSDRSRRLRPACGGGSRPLVRSGGPTAKQEARWPTRPWTCG